ncbi:restriction endonuclease subunit S [Streptococcus mitis]|uniref:Restriction endonuclease subunit S n=1 Tax=Streptococcus mitis TaxID=28037 RepID=A0A7X1QX73_STRMT|nr:restriction endonuclease subunit S [Streptococcus mitis]MQQ02591.1 restriction endonuclease subunit S [Streptococcus mitis]
MSISKIRFKGYENSLERKTLGEITTSFSGGTPKSSNKSYYEGNIPFIRSGEVKSKQTELFISDEALKNSSAKLVEKGDVLYALYGATSGEVAISQINGAINQAILAIKPNPGYSSEFIMNYLKKEKDNILEKYLQGGQGNLSAAIVKSIELYLPSIEEQSAIGSLFSTLDDLLASYKDNLANYQSLKVTMLSKMFPKAGQRVPEIRLDGFEGEWEVLQLSDICQKVTEKNKDNNFNETFTNSAEFGIISQRDFFEKDISNEKSLNTYYVVRNNDFVYNPRISNYAPVGPVKRNKLGRTGVMSPLYFVFRITNSNIDLNFLETFFNTNTWHKFMKLNGDSGARADRFAIKDSTFLTMPIAFPSLPEQQAIGAYFSNLDNLINSHQEKISQLETLKKKLLQDMFI